MSEAVVKEGGTLSAVLLVTGCCIGAGMIGLPVVSATAGFIPSLLAMFLCYAYATTTGLLILEAVLWFDQKVNLISLAHFALGRAGKLLTWSLFLFLFYCLFVAYIDGGGELFAQGIAEVTSHPVPREVGILYAVGVVAAIAFCGLKSVSLVSRVFLFGMAASYLSLLFIGFPHVEGERLLYTNWFAALSTLPILLICFGFQNLVPTLVYFAKKRVSVVKNAIFIGNLIPFVIYALWNGVILGLLPEAGSSEFAAATDKSTLVTDLLVKASESKLIIAFASVFAFLAIITPFMTNTIAFVDFLRDGLKIEKEGKRDALIYALVLLPPMLLSMAYPDLFLKALGIAGGFADVILFGLIPVAIIWVGRYVKEMEGPYRAPGGKPLLVAVALLSIVFLLIRN